MKDRDSNISATEVTERMAAMGRQTGKSGCMTPASDSPDHMAAFVEDVRRMWGLGEKQEITEANLVIREGSQTSASPWGGKNKSVRITHKPTGISHECGTERSWHLNRKRCLEMLQDSLDNLNARH